MKSVVSFMYDGNAAANGLKNSSTYADNFSVRMKQQVTQGCLVCGPLGACKKLEFSSISFSKNEKILKSSKNGQFAKAMVRQNGQYWCISGLI